MSNFDIFTVLFRPTDRVDARTGAASFFHAGAVQATCGSSPGSGLDLYTLAFT
jgi:hypothetical protein